MHEMQQAHRELERARAEAELRAGTDELTGTFNRRHFAQIAAEALTADPGRCGLLLLDADHFKQINDAYGHAVGDAVLVDLARRLALRASSPATAWPAGAARSSRCCCATSAPTGSSTRAPSAAAPAVSRDADRPRGRPAPAHHLDRRRPRRARTARPSTPWWTRPTRCLYAAKHQGRNRVSLAPGRKRTRPRRRASPRSSAWRGRSRSRAACARASPRSTPSRSRDSPTLTAEHLGLPVGVVLRCRLAGWLHDVGKLAMPEHDPDQAGPARRRRVGRSCAPTPRSARPSSIASPPCSEAAPAVRHHHERYAGGGYPDGLAGRRHPHRGAHRRRRGRLCRDDRDRPYSAARPPHEAAAELRRSAGSHLDPAVVDALLAVLGLSEGVMHRAA